MPHLAFKFSRPWRLAATALPAKGATEFGVKWFARQIQSTGVRSFINHSDGENALKFLKEVAARMVPGVEAKPREVPVGDHQANGFIEVGVRELKRQMRAIRYQLEINLGQALSDHDPVLAWIPQSVGDVIHEGRRHRKDGKTSYQKENGKRWLKPMYTFGERLFIKPAQERPG